VNRASTPGQKIISAIIVAALIGTAIARAAGWADAALSNRSSHDGPPRLQRGGSVVERRP
jgi:hypothetical protein